MRLTQTIYSLDHSWNFLVCSKQVQTGFRVILIEGVSVASSNFLIGFFSTSPEKVSNHFKSLENERESLEIADDSITTRNLAKYLKKDSNLKENSSIYAGIRLVAEPIHNQVERRHCEWHIVCVHSTISSVVAPNTAPYNWYAQRV